MKKNFFAPLLICIFCLTSCISQENPPEIKTPDQSKYTTETVVDGIEIPWGMDFINENEMLVTEKKGILYRVSNGKKTEVSGLPEVYQRGQGGLMDVALHPDFNMNKTIYLTIGVHLEGEKGGTTALYCAKLNENSLSNLKLLYKGQPNTKRGNTGVQELFLMTKDIYFLVLEIEEIAMSIPKTSIVMGQNLSFESRWKYSGRQPICQPRWSSKSSIPLWTQESPGNDCSSENW